MLITSLTVWIVVFVTLAGGARAQSSAADASPMPTEYYYQFQSPIFEIAQAELRFNQTGAGRFVFRRKGDDRPVQIQLHLLPKTVERINELLAEAQFLVSDIDYQGHRDLSHLGTTTLRVRHGSRQRQVSFNYTRHPAMRLLARLLRNIVTQESRVFAIRLARQYEPLGLDRQLIGLKREVKNGWVAEPEKLVPLLQDLQSDDGLLLIARRRAGEILRLIKKR